MAEDGLRQIALLERCVGVYEAPVGDAPEHLRALASFAVSQARGDRDAVGRFDRHPHRNAVLGRGAAADERADVASGEPVHRRPLQG